MEDAIFANLADRIPKRLRKPYQVIAHTLRSFSEDECSLRAAALSYHVLLSIFPLLLFMLFIGGRVIQSGNTQTVLLSYVRRAFPQLAAQVTELIGRTVAASTSFGILGALGLVWSSSALFAVLTGTFNVIWEAEPRSLWLRRLISIITVLAMAVLFTFSLLARTLIAFNITPSALISQQWVSLGADLTVTISLLTILYLWLPNRSVDWRAALSGAVVAAFLWQIAKTAFSAYLSFGPDRFGAIYGSIGSVIVLVLWVYFSSLIMFLGAETAAALEAEVWPR